MAAVSLMAPGARATGSTLRAFMEWAVAEVLEYGSPDSVVPAGLAPPRWGWDGLEADPPRRHT